MLDPQSEIAELLGSIASTAVQAVAAARTPLDAELALGPLFGMLAEMAPPESTPLFREEMRRDLVTGLVTWAETTASADALAFLRVAAVVGDPTGREQARAAAERLAATGVADRPWAGTLGRPQLIRAWWYADVLVNQESVTLEYEYHHRGHVMGVLVDHGLGGGIKDCWFADGRKVRGLRDRTAARFADNPMGRFEDIDARRALAILTPALDLPPCPAQPDQIEDVTRFLEVLRSRVVALAADPG